MSHFNLKKKQKLCNFDKKKTFLFCIVRLVQLSMNILMVIFLIVHQETMFQNCVKIHASSSSWRFGRAFVMNSEVLENY